MLRVVIPGVSLMLVLLAAACGKQERRAYEGHGCSTESSDDPQYSCTPQLDLVCIATYSQVITVERVAKRFDGGARDVYVCRHPCSPDGGPAQCPPDEVCCTGRIHGKDYGKTGGCTPAMFCDSLTTVAMDGGVRIRPDAGTDGPRDAAGDSAADAPANSPADAPDAAVDASTD